LTPHAGGGMPAIPGVGGDGAGFLPTLRLLVPLLAALFFPTGV